jgi:hypothetical protein
MKKNMLPGILLLVVIHVFSQDITRQDADSMITALKKSKQDIHRVDLLLRLAQYSYFQTGRNTIDLIALRFISTKQNF